MKTPGIPKNEGERLRELESYAILDTLAEEDFDNLTAIASEICDTPISLISLIDEKRQWFKSHHGLDVSETPREHAFCAHTIIDPLHMLIVEDSRLDDRFKNNPLVTGDPHVIFYAGVPLVTEQGFPLGTLCVIDEKPKMLKSNQIQSLKSLANQVMKLLELRKTNSLLQQTMVDLKQSNMDLEDFAYIAAHDIKSPLKNIEALTKLMSDQYGASFPQDCLDMLEMIKNASGKLTSLVNGLLEYSKNNKILNNSKSSIDLGMLVKEIEGLLKFETECRIELRSDINQLHSNKTALEQILINLVANAIKYNDKEVAHIEIGVTENDSVYTVYVEDNGPGIARDHQEKIFEVFSVLASKDRFGESSTGIGLATVKKLVQGLGGTIYLDPASINGARFVFTLKK